MDTKKLENFDDEALLEKVRKNPDGPWLGYLLERYTALLYGVCMKYLKNQNAAADAVQQIFLITIEYCRKKHEITIFRAWLYQVAKNYCLKELKKSFGMLEENEIPQSGTAPEPINFQELISNEHTFDLLFESLSKLQQHQQQCIRLFYFEKISYRKIAVTLSMTELQVKSYIQNGKRNLKNMVEQSLTKKHGHQ